MNAETLLPDSTYDEGCLVLAFFLKPNTFFD
jgi:hypothetical protein